VLARFVLVTVAVSVLVAAAQSVAAQEPARRAQTHTVSARVLSILEEGVTQVGPVTQPYQRLLVELTSEPEKGRTVGGPALRTG
jgi:protein-disulfide isomerase